jgi:hypothetical protein
MCLEFELMSLQHSAPPGLNIERALTELLGMDSTAIKEIYLSQNASLFAPMPQTINNDLYTMLLIQAASKRTEWLFLNDFQVDFSKISHFDLETIASQSTDTSRVTNLSLIDCRIGGLNALFNSVLLSKEKLEQVIIIYNQDLNDGHEDSSDDESFDEEGNISAYKISSELILSNMHQFKNLQYFELSIYNEV